MGVIYDGILNKERYIKAKVKVLWILKEAYDKDGKGNFTKEGGWHLNKLLTSKTKKGEYTSKTFNNINKTMTEVFGCLNVDDVAILNINNKSATSKSNNNILKKVFQERKNEIESRIKNINPCIVIFGGTSHFFEKEWSTNRIKDIPNGCNYFFKEINSKKVLCLAVYHPSDRRFVSTCIPEIKAVVEKKLLI